MNDFKTDYLNGETCLENIDDYVNKWHNTKTNLSLIEYLGLSKYEYKLFLEDWNKFKIKMLNWKLGIIKDIIQAEMYYAKCALERKKI